MLGDQWESVRPALFYLLHSPDQKTYTHLFTLPSDQLKHQLFWALRQIVKAITQQGPLLIIVENLQWADDVSLDFLSASLSLEPLAPVRFLGTTWPEGWERLATLAEGHHTKANIQEIVLAPFAEQEALAFIQTLVPSISPAYITALLAQSQGNPLYIQSIAEDFQLGIREIETPLPATIGEIFLHRLTHLPPSVRTLVEVASIIGSPIDIAVLEKIIERKGAAVNDLRQDLETAQAWGFLQPVENTWVFRAHAIEKAIYTSLAPAVRSEWHLLIAQTIEDLWPIEHPWRLAYLATHYQQGAHAQQAVQYLLKAGIEATQQHPKREAITLLSQAHTLAPCLLSDIWQSLWATPSSPQDNMNKPPRCMKKLSTLQSKCRKHRRASKLRFFVCKAVSQKCAANIVKPSNGSNKPTHFSKSANVTMQNGSKKHAFAVIWG